MKELASFQNLTFPARRSVQVQQTGLRLQASRALQCERACLVSFLMLSARFLQLRQQLLVTLVREWHRRLDEGQRHVQI
jgi:hypothetical protein